MNAYDTEVASGFLEKQGFKVFHESGEEDTPGPILKIGDYYFPETDVYLMNTCSVREHAEDRVYSRLGMLRRVKEKNPNLIVGLMGCMVEEHKQKLFNRFPHLDLMIGTRNIKELPDLIRDVQSRRRQVSKIKQDGISIEYTEQIKRSSKFHAWLPIMTGCNKVCTFCIVPVTRGAEVSMPSREVYREASRLADEGVKWITLLGQNVNSYQGQGAQPTGFPELLESLCRIEGLERISFTTSHPSDATPELYRVIADNPKISRRFHLPLQSGSDRMLKRMKRLHTYEDYCRKIEMMRKTIPGVSVTTDIISGFCGETQEDHDATVKALKELEFDGAYIYKYSVREQTPASKLEDDVPMLEKERRNRELLEIQRQIASRNCRRLIGETLNVFIEGTSPKDPSRLHGRSDAEKKVVFPGEAALLGQFRKVRLEDCKNETFIGALIS